MCTKKLKAKQYFGGALCLVFECVHYFSKLFVMYLINTIISIDNAEGTNML